MTRDLITIIATRKAMSDKRTMIIKISKILIIAQTTKKIQIDTTKTEKTQIITIKEEEIITIIPEKKNAIIIKK